MNKAFAFAIHIPKHNRTQNRWSSKVEIDISIRVNIVAPVFRLYLATLLTKHGDID